MFRDTCEHYADGQEQGAEDGQGDLTVGPDGYAPDGDAAVDFLHGRRRVQASRGRRARRRRDRSQVIAGRHPTGSGWRKMSRSIILYLWRYNLSTKCPMSVGDWTAQ